MTATELLALLQSEVDDDGITLDEALRWFNACSDEIAPKARIRQRSRSYLLDDHDTDRVALPDDFVQMYELRYAQDEGQEFRTIRDLDLMPHAHNGYRRWGQLLLFNPPLPGGVLELDYFRTLNRLTQGTDVPEIPPQFHTLYVYYGATRYWAHWDRQDVSEAQRRAEERYYELLARLDAHTSAKYRVRDVLPRMARLRRWSESWDDYLR